MDMTTKVKVKVNESEVEEERNPVDVKLYPLYYSEAVDRCYGNNFFLDDTIRNEF